MAAITKELAVRANTPTINDHIYSEELLKSMAHTMVNKPIYMGVDNAISGDLRNIIATVIAANYADGGVTLKINTLRGVTYHKDIWNYADLTTYGEGEIAEDDRTIVSCRVINLFLRPRSRPA